MTNFIKSVMDDKQFWTQKVITVITGIGILVAFHILGKAAEKTILRNASDPKPSVTIVTLSHMAYYTLLAIGLLLVLRVVGLEIASIIAVVSAVGFALGLSLQGALSDIASGILLTFFKIFDIGDVIIVGETEGKVIDFKLIHTVIEELNTKSITVIPNRLMQESVVSNITKQGWHYFVIDMLVSNENKDFDKIRSTIQGALKDTKRFPDVKQDMPHRVSVADMSKAGTVMRVRVPATTDGDIAVKRGDIRNALRMVLIEAGIIMVNPRAVAV